MERTSSTDSEDQPVGAAGAAGDREESGGGVGVPDGRRVMWGILLSAVAPGSGLIVLRRDRLGMAVAALLSVLASVLAWRLLLSREALGLVGYSVAGVAIMVWAVQFVLAVSVARRSFGSRGSDRASMLLAKADACVLDDRLSEAERHLRDALAIDDENPLHWRRFAELMTLLGKFEASIEAHERVIDLDVLGEHRRESIMTIEKLRAVTPGGESTVG